VDTNLIFVGICDQYFVKIAKVTMGGISETRVTSAMRRYCIGGSLGHDGFLAPVLANRGGVAQRIVRPVRS
jgi:hypothetical protein